MQSVESLLAQREIAAARRDFALVAEIDDVLRRAGYVENAVRATERAVPQKPRGRPRKSAE